MNNHRGNDIFLAVIGVTTLIVAVIGATFAYFSANARSENDAIQVESTVLELGYDDDKRGLKTDLIPAADNIAIAGANRLGKGGKQCIDDYGSQICGVYVFTVGNPNPGTAQTIYGTLNVVTNEFQNLYFAIYEGNANGDEDFEEWDELIDADDDENSKVQNLVFGPYKFPTADDDNQSVPLTGVNKTLIGSKSDYDDDGEVTTDGFDPKKPSTYTLYSETFQEDGEEVTRYNKVTYTMVIWVHEIKDDEGVENGDQTAVDSGASFAAGITFNTSDGNSGVTGVIAAAGNQ